MTHGGGWQYALRKILKTFCRKKKGRFAGSVHDQRGVLQRLGRLGMVSLIKRDPVTWAEYANSLQMQVKFLRVKFREGEWGEVKMR